MTHRGRTKLPRSAARDRHSASGRGAAEGGPRVRVSVVQQLGAEANALLAEAIERAGLWRQIAATRSALRRRRSQLRIVIKPDLDVFDARGLTGTDPALVEHLVDLLHDRGFENVAVIDGRNEDDAWLQNREALVVPELAGYRFRTGKGRVYEIVPCAGQAPGSTDAGQHGPVTLNPHWVEADFRINFAKNKTHEDSFFALCVHNLAGVVVATDEAGARRDLHRQVAEPCLAVLRQAPPHFNIIDAYVSCHGGAGHRAGWPAQTHCIIASPDALLADWAGAAKMGADPYASPANALALRNAGLPKRYEIDGDLAPYRLWRNVHPLVAHSARLRNASDALGAIAPGWFQSIDRELFPPKDYYNDRINSFVAPLMAQVDDNPRSYWAVVVLNYVVARIDAAIVAQQTLFSKDKLKRRHLPLTLDIGEFAISDYEAIDDHISPYEQILESMPPNRAGLRWRHVDGAVIFSGSHTFPIPFERFCGAVDITRSIQYMNDYIGGSTVAVSRDRRGRVLQQVERNLYLQQPNWLVLFGGEVIDVEKLESIRYEDDRRTICWRTVRSANDSARYDDGRVTFERTAPGETTVRVFARQQFTLPLFFKVFDVNLAPGIRDPIIEAAYSTFFTGTMANLQAAYEGRDFRIGREPGGERQASGDLLRYLATAAAAVAELLRHGGDLSDLARWAFPPQSSPRLPAATRETDADGFRHFEGAAPGAVGSTASSQEKAIVAGLAALARDTPEYLAGLADAVSRDLDRMAGAAPGTAPT